MQIERDEEKKMEGNGRSFFYHKPHDQCSCNLKMHKKLPFIFSLDHLCLKKEKKRSKEVYMETAFPVAALNSFSFFLFFVEKKCFLFTILFSACTYISFPLAAKKTSLKQFFKAKLYKL